MSQSAVLVRQESRALERSEIERRRVIVARLRWLESHMTPAEIMEALRRETPPIIVTVRTVERDCTATRSRWRAPHRNRCGPLIPDSPSRASEPWRNSLHACRRTGASR
jgi:hypothetical protein